MRQPTKKKLREDISELKSELFRAISQLPDSELKNRLKVKYPDYFMQVYLDKYADVSFIDVLLNEVNKQPVNETGEFRWFENR